MQRLRGTAIGVLHTGRLSHGRMRLALPSVALPCLHAPMPTVAGCAAAFAGRAERSSQCNCGWAARRVATDPQQLGAALAAIAGGTHAPSGGVVRRVSGAGSESVRLLAVHCTSAHTDEVVVRYSCGIDRLSGNRVYSCVVRRAGHPSGPYPLAAHPAADARKVRPKLVVAGEHCTHPHAHGDIGAGTSRSLRSRASRCVCAWHG